jgi:UDP-N-acetyl-D-glucosamine dehydrogenase
VLERLAAGGADVSYHDPYVPELELGGERRASIPLDPVSLGAADAVVILTAHPQVDVAAVVQAATLVLDARGVTVGIDEPHVERL